MSILYCLPLSLSHKTLKQGEIEIAFLRNDKLQMKPTVLNGEGSIQYILDDHWQYQRMKEEMFKAYIDKPLHRVSFYSCDESF